MPGNKSTMLFRNVLTAVVLLLLMGCSQVIPATPGSQASPSSSTQQVSASPTLGIATPDRFTQSTTKNPERVPPTESSDPVTGEVPDQLLDEILRDMIERTGAARDKIAVIRAQATVWNDGSLGCPQPGVFYTQAMVNGYWVVLEVDGQKYDYRAADTGYFFLCGDGIPPISPPSTPTS